MLEREEPESEGPVEDEAHSLPEGATENPEVGHPLPGEGVGLPDEGPGRAAEKSTPTIGTDDQGEPTEETAEKKGMRQGGKQE